MRASQRTRLAAHKGRSSREVRRKSLVQVLKLPSPTVANPLRYNSSPYKSALGHPFTVVNLIKPRLEKGKFCDESRRPRNRPLARLIVLSQNEPRKYGYTRVSADDQPLSCSSPL